ncbi:MAG: arginine--tRNA ligase [Chloroflexi bacterium]|nr:arginine--tRNA ligase [Chloroflexota bacterium]
MLVKDKLARLLMEAALQAQQRGLLPPVALPPATVERPASPEHGDYASSLPLKLGRTAGIKPLTVAETLVALLPSAPELGQVQVASPGFINFILKREWLLEQVATILEQGESYGSLDLGQGTRLQLEFVSVNPTGPLHVGHGRGAVLGSALANVLAAAGYQVETEYYINDAGSQVENFARSLYVRCLEARGRPAQMPEGGYMGSYVRDLAQEALKELGASLLDRPEGEALAELSRFGLKRMLDAIRQDLELLGVRFHVWFNEKSLFQEGQFPKAMAQLQGRGFLATREGATWFVSTALGNDKDNVLIRNDGTPTYFASDIAYHYNKFLERGFQRVINIWGADHQGHVSRMKAAVSALGIEPERLDIIIGQMVTLRRGGEVVRISKRSGELITLRELVEEVGPDACRFVFLSRSAAAQMDFDLELAKQESPENPVYYVQYAHARIASILRLAREQGLDWARGDPLRLEHPAELALIRQMLLLPEVVETVALSLEPHHLPHYALELATAFHTFYKQCRVLGKGPTSEARLKLAEAAKVVLARTLHLMGMAAPESM